MDFQAIIFKKEDRVAIMTLNRPERLNALNQQMEEELAQAIEDVSRDDEIRILVLTGAGRSFCAGADFQFDRVRTGEVTPAEAEAEALKGIFSEMKRGKLLHRMSREVVLGLQRLDKPTIAVVNGDAAGAGFDLALACDIRIGSPKTRFMIGYTRMGVIPDLGGTWFLPRIVGLGKALELIYTSDFCEGEEAYRIGLLNRLVPAEQLESEAMALAQRLALGPPVAYRLSKLQVYKGLEMDLESALAFLAACIPLITSTEDYEEAVKAFVEKRKPVFKGK